jgi:SagB-type dehydrogenase family enzyme
MSLEPPVGDNLSNHDAAGDIIAYHDRTKHHPERYANGPGGLDWANQPDPFRQFSSAPTFRLPLAGPDETPPAAVLFGAATAKSKPLTFERISLYLELSLGLSARKEIATSSWYLRMNPSSGNLHPTEAYVILPGLPGFPGGAGVYHYAPLHHELEQRARWRQTQNPKAAEFHVGLTSVTWREAWKYGERAFRYCQHDVGHALAALRFAAAALGWRAQLLPEWDDAHLAGLLGLDRVEDFADAERETPELLVRVNVDETAGAILSSATDAPTEWFGRANRLSHFHVEWPVINEAIASSEKKAGSANQPENREFVPWSPPVPPACGHSAGQLIRQRRSAVDFDGVTHISRDTFLAILDTTLPRTFTPPFDAWPFPPRLNLVLMVHRVTGLEPGLYLWLRTPADTDALRRAFGTNLNWEAATDSAITTPLFRLGRGDFRDFSRTLSCHQNIAADGAFSLGMLARFEPVLQERGAGAYRELFWEAGMIGQALYLSAEAAGVRGTGIGCYFDEVLHRALGLSGHAWQSLYHFTVGRPVEDPRLRTSPPYPRLAAGAP